MTFSPVDVPVDVGVLLLGVSATQTLADLVAVVITVCPGNTKKGIPLNL